MTASRPTEVVERCPAPTIRQIVARGGGTVPAPLTEEPPVHHDTADIPYARYTDPAWHAREMERLWPRVWQWACREEHIPEPGDWFVYDIGHWSVLIVRDEDRTVRAYINACLHRGTKLKASGTDGWSPAIACPYHGWRWALDGTLEELPCAWDFPHADREALRLPEAKVGLWGGFVFVNLDPGATPLEDFLGVLPRHFAAWDLSRRHVAVHVEKELACNWKVAAEAFMESYHTMTTHPQLLAGLQDINTQYDVFGPNISRYYSASGVASPNYPHALTEEELVATMFVGDREATAGSALAPGETARDYMARQIRDVFGAAYGVDLSATSDSEILDTIGYGVFPNTTFFAGVSIPMVYRFRPLGRDPERALFDLVILRPNRDDGTPPPPPARPHRLREDESYALVPGLDAGLAAVFDQDTDNMRFQQEGMATSRKAGATLARYQEIRIRHFHQTLQAWCED